MSKDRAAPFSRKHRRYWLPVTGGMILIGAINVSLGMCSYTPPPSRTEQIQVVIPPPSNRHAEAGIPDAGPTDGAAPSDGAVAPDDALSANAALPANAALAANNAAPAGAAAPADAAASAKGAASADAALTPRH